MYDFTYIQNKGTLRNGEKGATKSYVQKMGRYWTKDTNLVKNEYNLNTCWTQWLITVVPALVRLKQETCEFEVSLGYLASLSLFLSPSKPSNNKGLEIH